jgi:hypothetical protein
MMARPNTQPFSLFWNAERQPGTVADSKKELERLANTALEFLMANLT